MAKLNHSDPEETPKSAKTLRWANRGLKHQKRENRGRNLFFDRIAQRTSPNSEKKKGVSDPEFVTSDHDNTNRQIPSGNESKDTTNQYDYLNQGPRNIYFNIPLPPEALDEEGDPLVQFKRNKIRTAKYTPLSFVPKNIWFQFHNIANVYFLFLIILAVGSNFLS